MRQFFVQIKASTVVGLSEDLKSSRIRPPELKACLEATDVAGITMTSTAIRENRGKFSWFYFHHSSIKRSAWRGYWVLPGISRIATLFASGCFQKVSDPACSLKVASRIFARNEE
ncbi:unnamed protein product [Albugo candida]|uniref:Uncharacterized protein n=1 Tax=Albugo candida TaxID=65357 RepID=A0A024FX49_9STRA|nr:unnamed protein product [Albugo candida]|eukprot:CCI11239.1 unnamed protein product [Albugo candida]